MLDFGLYLFYIMLVIAVIVAIAFSAVNALKTPGGLVKSLIFIGVFAVAFFICYSVSDGTVSEKDLAMGVNENIAKMISAGLILFYASLAVAFLVLVYAEIAKALK